MRTQRRIGIPSVLAMLILSAGIAGQNSFAAPQPTAKEILKNASRHYDAVRDYTANVKVSVDSPSLKMPEMLAKVYFKKPDKLHVESRDGFALLPKHGLITGNPLEAFFGSSGSLGPRQRVLDSDCFVVKASQKKDDVLVRSTAWIDSTSWLVRQLHVVPEQGPVMKVKIWYVRVDGKYWMPATTSAQVSIPPFPGAKPDQGSKPDKPTIITMKFSDYRVNRGLSDKIFEKQEGSK